MEDIRRVIVVDLSFHERHDLSRSAYYRPATATEPAYSPSILQDIKNTGRGPCRRDIACLTIWDGEEDYSKEPLLKEWIDPSSKGKAIISPEAKKWLKPHEVKKLNELAKKCVIAEESHGLPSGTLTRSW